MIRYQDINCHIIFDLRMDLQQKSRFLAGGHTTCAPNSITYYRVVSRDIICIGFILEYLHGVDITAIDMENAYLNAPCAENIYFVGGDECGEDKVSVLNIDHALHGIKYAGYSWRSVLAVVLQEIGLDPTTIDPNFWIRAAMRLYGYEYYKMIHVYVDDIMIVYYIGDEVARKIDKFYNIKEGSQGPPTRYIEADTENIQTNVES